MKDLYNEPTDYLFKVCKRIYHSKITTIKYDVLSDMMQEFGLEINRSYSYLCDRYDPETIRVFNFLTNKSINLEVHEIKTNPELLRKNVDILWTKNDITEYAINYYPNWLKEQEQDKKIRNNERLTKSSFIIALIALFISGVQLVVDYYDIHYGKDFRHETKIIELLEIQNKQNDLLIKHFNTDTIKVK